MAVSDRRPRRQDDAVRGAPPGPAHRTKPPVLGALTPGIAPAGGAGVANMRAGGRASRERPRCLGWRATPGLRPRAPGMIPARRGQPLPRVCIGAALPCRAPGAGIAVAPGAPPAGPAASSRTRAARRGSRGPRRIRRGIARGGSARQRRGRGRPGSGRMGRQAPPPRGSQRRGRRVRRGGAALLAPRRPASGAPGCGDLAPRRCGYGGGEPSPAHGGPAAATGVRSAVSAARVGAGTNGRP
jgi:hypothetical protein